MVAEAGVAHGKLGGRGHAAALAQQVTPTSRRVVLIAGVPVLVALMTLSACTSQTKGAEHPSATASHDAGQPPPVTAPATTAAVVPKAVITAAPDGGTAVSPIQPVTVAVAHGKLTSVKLLNPEGKVVSGALAAGATSWRSTEVLGFSRTYTLSAVAVDADGRSATKTTRFTTLTPDNMTMPYLQRPGGYSLTDGATYGVGIVPVVHFDEAISNKRAAEKALLVSTTPHVEGVWNWVDDQNAHWRPRGYLAPGSKVTVTANLYGVQVGSGLYGQSDQSVSFKVGATHIAVADDITHTVRVYFNGQLMRTMPTSMGRGGFVDGKGGIKIPLWTMPGTYTVLAHENPAIMSSDSYG
ncbi:MAG: Ig-like domain-containing protein, partial [Jatrophihabitantaceae bacterium]